MSDEPQIQYMSEEEAVFTFQFEGQPVRVFASKTEVPRIVLEDVCKILGMTEAEALESLEDDGFPVDMIMIPEVH